MSEILTYSYKALVNDVENIYIWCKLNAFYPDIIVGIARGGLVPAVHLSNKFKKPLSVVNWSTRDFEDRDHYKWIDVVISSVEGRKFLVVEDIIDSGKTMREMFSSIKEYSQSDLKNIKTVSLWLNTGQGEFNPDYYCQPINRNLDKRWIMFPWEV